VRDRCGQRGAAMSGKGLLVALASIGLVGLPSGQLSAREIPVPQVAPLTLHEAPGARGLLNHFDGRLDRMAKAIRGHQRTRTRMYRWWDCVHPMRTDQVGDPEHGWGFEYDERDGTGVDTRTALVRRETAGRPDLLLLRFSRESGCLTKAPDPNGTGDDARPMAAAPRAVTRPTARTHGKWQKLRRLERRMNQTARRLGRLEDDFDRFDEWESCLSWLPVTEFGRTHQNLGYLYGEADGATSYRSAIDIDDSEWDDPDYMLLAFIGRDRPFSNVECGHEPGEGVDRVAPVWALRVRTDDEGSGERWTDRIDDLRDDLHAAQEDLEDMVEPAQEFIQFDECMFTVGVRSSGGPDDGYRYRTPSGESVRRAALAFDMTGMVLPQMDVMAFPGEEPPSIECNEDAGGQNTDE
jgi:hypothetical protein